MGARVLVVHLFSSGVMVGRGTVFITKGALRIKYRVSAIFCLPRGLLPQQVETHAFSTALRRLESYHGGGNLKRRGEEGGGRGKGGGPHLI